jgi:hypothetical protein
VNEDGKRVSVILPIEEYERMVEKLEDIEDARAADEVRATVARGEDEFNPYEQAREKIEGPARQTVSYSLSIPRSVNKRMERLPAEVYDRLDGAILALADEPRPPGSVNLRSGGLAHPGRRLPNRLRYR